MLAPTAIGVAPVSVLLPAAVSTIENLGSRPLRFVVAESAAEQAPADRRDGHLLQPGEREDVERLAADAPLWAWSDYPTRIGVGARLAG